MVVRTMCLECEAVTEKAQAVCELCVPVTDDDTEEEPFRAACLSTEYLRDQNKVCTEVYGACQHRYSLFLCIILACRCPLLNIGLPN